MIRIGTSNRRILTVLALLFILAVALGLFVGISDKLSRYERCEQAWINYSRAQPDDRVSLPEILSEDWCFDHLWRDG